MTNILTCPAHGAYAAHLGACPVCGVQAAKAPQIMATARLQAPTGIIRFTIDGQPQPKGRPRVVNGRAYTPQKTKAYEQLVAQLASFHIDTPYTTPVFVALSIYRQIARGKPDADNLAKSVLDGMEGIAYKNDSLVRKLFVSLEYVSENPRVNVAICPLGQWRTVLDSLD